MMMALDDCPRERRSVVNDFLNVFSCLDKLMFALGDQFGIMGFYDD